MDIEKKLNNISSRLRNLEKINIDLPAHINKSIDKRLRGKNPNESIHIYSTQDHINNTYIRNENCWCSDVDLSCISPWNSNGGNLMAGTLITPQHVLFANHFMVPNNTKIRFVSMKNEVVERTIVDQKYVGHKTDFNIGHLDSPVPNNIKPCKVLPSDWDRYIPFEKNEFDHTRLKFRLPTVALDQEEKALTSDVISIDKATKLIQCSSPSDQQRKRFNELIIRFDSGNPCFFITNSTFEFGDCELVLLTVWTRGGGGAGGFTSMFIDEINKTLFELREQYTRPEKLQEFDLYRFRLV